MSVDIENLGECEITVMELEDLNPADYNPRIITTAAREALKASIEKFGIVVPILLNKQTGNIIGGHQRYFILKELGITKTTVVVADMPLSEEKACNVALNSDHLTGDFVSGRARELLEEIKTTIPDLYNKLSFDTLLDSLKADTWDSDITPKEPKTGEEMNEVVVKVSCFEEDRIPVLDLLEEIFAGKDFVRIKVD